MRFTALGILVLLAGCGSEEPPPPAERPAVKGQPGQGTGPGVKRPETSESKRASGSMPVVQKVPTLTNPYPSLLRVGRLLEWEPSFDVAETTKGASAKIEGGPAGMTLRGLAVVYVPAEVGQGGFRYILKPKAGEERSFSFTFSVSPLAFDATGKVDFTPDAYALDPVSGHLFLLNGEKGGVAEIDPASGNQVFLYPAPGAPVALAIKGRTLMVANSAASTVDLFEIGAPARSRSIQLSMSGPAWLAVAPDDGTDYAYVAGDERHDRWVAQVDLKSGTQKKLLFTGETDAAVAVSRDGKLLYRPGIGALHRLDPSTGEVSKTPIAICQEGLPEPDAHGQYWLWTSGKITTLEMSGEIGKVGSRRPAFDTQSACIFSLDQGRDPAEPGMLIMTSLNTFQELRRVPLEKLNEPAQDGADRPRRARSPYRNPGFLAVDGSRRRVIVGMYEKVYVIPIDELSLPKAHLWTLQIPLPGQIAAGVSFDFALHFKNGLGFEGASVALKKGPQGMSLAAGRISFMPDVGQMGKHDLEFEVRFKDGSVETFRFPFRIVPKFYPGPADLRSIASSPDGETLGLVHTNGRSVSVLSTATGETRKVAQEFTAVEAVGFAPGRLLVADAGSVWIYDSTTLESRGTLRTGVPGITSVFAVPGQDDLAYSVAWVSGVAAKLHALDLNRRVARPVTVVGDYFPTEEVRLVRVPSSGEYLLVGMGGGGRIPHTITRVLLQDDRIVVVEGPVVIPGPPVMALDDSRGSLFIAGKGLVSPTDLSMVYAGAPAPDAAHHQKVYSGMYGRITGGPQALIVTFDGGEVRFLDGWSYAELQVLALTGAPADPSLRRKMIPATLPLAVAWAQGKRVFAVTGGKIFDLPIGELRGKLPEVTFGRFKGVPKSLEVTPGQKFMFKAEAVGLGKGTVYFSRGVPKGLTVDERTGDIRWDVPKDLAHSVTVQIGAKDERDVEASLRFRLRSTTQKGPDPEQLPVEKNVGLPTEPVDNPEYLAWSKCKPGSWVMTGMDTNSGTQIRFKTTLVEVTAEKVTLQSVGTMPLGDGLVQKITMADQRNAKIEPKDIPRLVKEGTETIQVGSKRLACIWKETVQSHDGRKTTFRTWWSDEVPGGVVRQLIGANRDGITVTNTVTAWEKK